MNFKGTPIALLTALALSAPAWAANPRTQPDDSWITVSGKVKSATAESFTLDYGRGQVLVEMDDWDWYGEGYNLMDGDEVTVRGRIDDDMFERRSIEAGSVYVEGLNTFFYASASDEEDAMHTTAFYASIPLATGDTRATGRVVDIEGRDIIVDTGLTRVRVDTMELPYNPLDQEGFQRVKIGDRVTVSGDMTPDLFGPRRELTADLLITLQKESAA